MSEVSLVDLQQKKDQIEKSVKRLQSKINALERKMMPFLLKQQMLRFVPSLQVGSTIEVHSSVFAGYLSGRYRDDDWLDMIITKFWIYSFDNPDLGMDFKLAAPKVKSDERKRFTLYVRCEGHEWRVKDSEISDGSDQETI